MAFVAKEEAKSFRSIVLDALEAILVISRTEFRGGFYNIVYQGTTAHKQYVPSSIKCYSQAVEHFAAILIPSFDEDMRKEYEEYTNQKNEIESKGEGLDIDKEILKLNKLLFIALNELLSRKKYLSNITRIEGEEEYK